MAENLQDQAARDRIEGVDSHDLAQNLTVLAGAGAGKTYELVERMVNQVRLADRAVDGLAAITFTRKAAGELRGRFFLRLRQAQEQATGAEARRLAQAMGRIDQCFIGTIHAFCGQLLRERPVEAGIRADFTELDEREERALCLRAWDDFVQQRYLEEDPRLEQLRRLGLRLEDLRTFFVRRCQFSELALKADSVPKPDLEKAVERGRVFVEQVQTQVPDPLPAGPDGFMTKFARLRLYLEHHQLHTDWEQACWLELLGALKGEDVTLKRWGGNREFAKELRDEIIPDLTENVVDPVLRQWRQHLYGHAAGFVDGAVGYYARQRLSTGQLTFQDLLLQATRMLREHPEVRRHFQRRYTSLFVDEFQDTDPIQAEMLFYLTGKEAQEQDWRQLAPHEGSIFLVGDEKQSIYRFRRADMQVFCQARAQLEVSGGETLKLNTNFRSFDKLCAWINRAFGHLFQHQSQEYQAGYDALAEVRRTDRDEFCVRKLVIEKVDRHRREPIVQADAERIAAFIAAALAGQTEFNGEGEESPLETRANPGDFMILTYTRKYLSAYARALEEYRIPYDLIGGGDLRESAEVRAVVQFLQAVYEPDNPLPLLSYLRGPLVGAGDDELYAYRKAGGEFQYQKALPDQLLPAVEQRFRAAYGRLRQAEDRLRTQPPAMAFEGILEELGLVAFAAAGRLGSSRAGGLLRLLALVRQWESQGWHWGQVVAELVLFLQDDEYEVESMTLESGERDVVRLMNLHQAKGLQAKVVFLADPYDTRIDKTGADFHVSRLGEAPYLSIPVFRPKGYQREIVAEPCGWPEDEEREQHYLDAEKLRLQYVAATRAENLLVVSCYQGNTAKGSWAALYPFLEEVPVLPAYRPEKVAALEGPPVELTQQRQERAVQWNLARKPTYALTTVTGELHPEEPQYGDQVVPDRGRDYGTVLHRLFEWAVRGELSADEASLIRCQLAKAGLDASLADVAQTALDTFRVSPIWGELQQAERVHTEVPFAVSFVRNGEKVVLKGAIDLIYHLDAGWKIVDFKSDTAIGGADIAILVARYTPQVQAYAQYWEQITGQQVVEKGLWLASVGSWQPF